MKWYERIIKRSQHIENKTFYVEDTPDITDEIEKSLWILKEDLDLPTEEVQRSVDSRKKAAGYSSEKLNN
tara:strand:+ start:205 stop:414 length:210 start_codon:yes stop_codon:yes gene_type:complete